MNDDELPDRLDRIAEWHSGLRRSEQTDLRRAAALLRVAADDRVQSRDGRFTITPLEMGRASDWASTRP